MKRRESSTLPTTRIALAVMALIASVAVGGCASGVYLPGAAGAGAKIARAFILSDDEVMAMANEACAAMDQQNVVASATEEQAIRLARITDGLENEDGLSLNFKVYLTEEVNAGAMPNGCVRVYSGLLDLATDDEVRGILGHEIGHVKLGHRKAKMRTALLARGIREGAASADPTAGDILYGELGDLAEAVVNAQFSQKEERAADAYGYDFADAYGYDFMVRRGWDPRAMVTMLEKLPGKGGLLSSHPGSAKRAARIQKRIEANH